MTFLAIDALILLYGGIELWRSMIRRLGAGPLSNLDVGEPELSSYPADEGIDDFITKQDPNRESRSKIHQCAPRNCNGMLAPELRIPLDKFG